MKIQSVNVDNDVAYRRLPVVTLQPVELEAYESPKPGLIKNILPGLTAGVTVNSAWSGFQASNTLGADEIAKLLIKNGLSPEHAPTVSQQAYEIIRAEPTKVLLVAVAAGGTAWAVVDTAGKLCGIAVPTWRKVIISAVIAIAAGFAYHYLRTKGYLQ